MNTITKMGIQMAGEQAIGFFGNGFHCAEAVTTAALKAMGEDPLEAAAHATAFGGGFGRTHQEACGALCGALIAIGHLYGRRNLGDAWDLPARLGAAIRQRFLDDFGTTHCASLRNRFGEERQMAECRKLTGRVTTALLALLSEKNE
jgi:C_GCAxxG_C_C family probable redox protein